MMDLNLNGNSEIIKVNKDEEGVTIVSGRELHEFLEVKSNYSTWIKRMVEYGFEENVDYIEVWSDSKNGIAIAEEFSPQKMSSLGYEKNHVIKLDMAKEISMIQRTDRGKQARQYFISIEKQFKNQIANTPLDSYMIEDRIERARRWADEEEVRVQLLLDNKQATKTIEEQAPKVKYHDAVMESTTTVPISVIAGDYGTTSIKMNNILNILDIQYKVGKTWKLYAKYEGLGYTENVQGKNYTHMKWTAKGRKFIYDMVKANGGVPLSEREEYNKHIISLG